jgi:hypothetical protein
MAYTYKAELVPFSEGQSKVSFDITPFKCAVEGCTDYVRQLLTVPGEDIGRPSKLYRVLRCLSCRFDDPCHTYYDEAGIPVKIETRYGESEHGFNEGSFGQVAVDQPIARSRPSRLANGRWRRTVLAPRRMATTLSGLPEGNGLHPPTRLCYASGTK